MTGVKPIHGRLDSESIRLSCPYDDETVNALRKLRVRKYDIKAKEWVIPYSLDSVAELVDLVGIQHVMLEPDLDLRLRKDLEDRQVALGHRARGDADLGDFPFFTDPWNHQRAAIAAAASLSAYALFWEMGTGKTKAAIDIIRWRAEHNGLTHALIIAPNEVIYNWKREIALHAGAEALILEGPLKQRAEILRRRDLPLYTVVNVESVAPLHESLAARKWGAIIVDESTRFKNHKAQRTRALRKLHADFRMIMTGTPVTQHLLDLYAPMEFLYPGIFGTYNNFRWRYFIERWDGRGRPALVPNPNTLPELLGIIDNVSYRVTKKEVLPDLPEKMPVQYQEVVLHGDQAAAYKQMLQDYMVWFRTLVGDVQTHAAIVLTQKLRLAQITAGYIVDEVSGVPHWFPNHAKGNVIDDLVSDILPGKVVIFCHFRAEVEHYQQRYSEYGSALIYGGMQPRDRDAIVDAFQTGTEIQVLVCQEGSGGIGINLFASSTAIYTSRSWSLEQWLQSQDRLHRAGQKNPVTIVVVQARKTIDEEIDDVLEGKLTISDIITRDSQR